MSRTPGRSQTPNPPDPYKRSRRGEVVNIKLGRPLKKGNVEFEPEIVPKQPITNGLVRFKMSERWYKGSTAAKKWHLVPYINRLGMVHAIGVATWMCHPAQLFATVVSTVFKRLWGLCRTIRKRFRPSSDLLYKISAHYVVTSDEWFFRRCHEMISRRRTKELGRFYYRCSKHMDKHKRFLLDQAQTAALWLQSRADRCPLREMSTRHTNDSRDYPATSSRWGSPRYRFDLEVTHWAQCYTGSNARPMTNRSGHAAARYRAGRMSRTVDEHLSSSNGRGAFVFRGISI